MMMMIKRGRELEFEFRKEEEDADEKVMCETMQSVEGKLLLHHAMNARTFAAVNSN